MYKLQAQSQLGRHHETCPREQDPDGAHTAPACALWPQMSPLPLFPNMNSCSAFCKPRLPASLPAPPASVTTGLCLSSSFNPNKELGRQRPAERQRGSAVLRWAQGVQVCVCCWGGCLLERPWAGGWTQGRTEQVRLHTGTAWIKAGRPEDTLGEETARGFCLTAEESLPEQWDVRLLPEDYNACQVEVQTLSP